MANESGAIDLGSLSKEEQEAVAGLADQQPEDEKPQAHQARTAFLVIVEEDNRAWVQPDCNFDLALDHYPTPAEVYGALVYCKRDADAMANVQAMDAFMTRKGQIIAAQQKAAAEEAQIRQALGPDLTRGPRR